MLSKGEVPIGVFLCFFGSILPMLTFFLRFWWVWGGLEWSKMVHGTRTIHFPVPVPHIDHSRPISTPFWASQAKLLGAFGALGGGKHFRNIDPGIWNLAWNYEKI